RRRARTRRSPTRARLARRHTMAEKHRTQARRCGQSKGQESARLPSRVLVVGTPDATTAPHAPARAAPRAAHCNHQPARVVLKPSLAILSLNLLNLLTSAGVPVRYVRVQLQLGQGVILGTL